MVKLFRFMLLAGAAVVIAGCHNAEYYRQQRVDFARKHFEDIHGKVIAPGTVFALSQCIEIALKQNLDLRVYELQEAVDRERVTAAMLGMLPDLTITDDYTARNNQPGSSSQNLQTGAQTYPPSKSSEKTENDFKIELVLSVLDFGLAYLNSVQSEDRSLITKEQERRAAQNLILDVVRTYFKVAATQDAIENTEKLLVRCKDIEKTFDALKDSRDISPLLVLDERKRFIRLEKSLMEYRRSYENACIELRALMGYLPINDIKVDTRCLQDLKILNLPDIEMLEKVALIERPELYQLDIEANVTLTEARKTILMMFPNVKVFADFTDSSNKFLYNQSWWEIGVRAAYNLLKLPEQISKYRALDKEGDSIALRTLALSIGVISQVRIAHANILEVKERYELDQRTWEAYQSHLKIAQQNYKSGGALSRLELDRYEFETTEARIDRTLALGNYYLAYYRLLNTVGIQSIDKQSLDKITQEINASEAKLKQKTQPESPAAVKAMKTIKDNVITFNGVVLGDNTMAKGERDKLTALIPKSK